VKVTLLPPAMEGAYERFVSSHPESAIYASLAYRTFLRTATGASDRYLVAVDGETIVGVLPALLQQDHGRGAVLNSLPFFGSFGGVLADAKCPGVAAALVDAFAGTAEAERCISRTIITSPLGAGTGAYEQRPHTFQDRRNAQITPLPEDGPDLDARLLALFEDPRPRNIRRAEKSGVTVTERWDEDALRFVARVHDDNISALGGIVKPLDVFLAVPQCFDRSQYSVFVGSRDGRDVAALLAFFYNGTVDYYTPVILHEERANQPLSLIVFEGMKRAVRRGFRRWNWGGTWATQLSLYDFKKRWGAVDHPYVYFTTVADSVLDRTREDILSAHPYFYVCPFDQLRRPA
jgi:hypothetical protein